ncbi:hypothetical protein V6N13_019829 [Hibiscus sabdariffa]
MTYLLTIMDEELSQMLEDVNLSYLKEIFSDVIHWAVRTSYSKRETWLEIRGLPLHCWNNVSLKKVADLWGCLRLLRKMTNIPLTIQKEKICVKSDESVIESESDLKSDSEQNRHEAVDDGRSCSGTEVEALNGMCVDKDHIKFLNWEKENCGDKIIEAELMGGVSKDEKLTAFHVNGVEESNKKVCTLSHDKKEDVGNSIGVQRVKYVEKVGQENIKPDGSDNGPIWVSLNRYGPKGQIGMGFKDKAQEFKSSWANMIDETLNSGKDFNLSDDGKALSDEVGRLWVDDAFMFNFSAAMGRSGWVIVCLDYKALSGSGFCVFPTIHILRRMEKFESHGRKSIPIGVIAVFVALEI